MRPTPIAITRGLRPGSSNVSARRAQIRMLSTRAASRRFIISLLLTHGAIATDLDGRGKTVAGAAGAEWMCSLLNIRR